MADEKRLCVYRHTSPSGKVYIGITSQSPQRRWQRGFGYKENPHLYAGIVKHGWENFTHEILAEGLTKTEAEQMEIDLIAKHNSTDRSCGYNIAIGGGINYPSEDGRERLRRLWTGHVVSEETRRKISETQKGKIIPLETRLKMSNSRKGKRMSAETYRKVNEAKFKPVLCVETGETFRCMKDAQLKYKTAHISAVCKGHRNTAAGYHWEYAEGGDVEHGGREIV